MSHASMMTAIKRKKELRNKVDVNFDGKVSFIEYLLYQYQDIDGVDPANFCKRIMTAPDENKEMREARLALQEVEKQIRAYENKEMREARLALQEVEKH